MPGVRLRAPAKLNLGLHLLARRPDGYHEIETIFVPLRLYDDVRIELGSPGTGLRLDVGDSGLPTGEDNLVIRAAARICDRLGAPRDLRIRLDKRIPIAAGLGGGSSDAAMVLLGVEELLGARLPESERRAIARDLGADVPFFLAPRPSVGRGIGDRLEPLADVPAMTWVLVAFAFPISTPWAYREASRRLTLPRERTSIAALLGPAGVAMSPRNDLESAAAQRHPEIRHARRALEGAGAKVTGMSGSGPTVYGCFESAEQARRATREIELPQGAGALVTSSPPSEPSSWDWGVAKW